MASGDNPDVIEIVETSFAVAGPSSITNSSGDHAADLDSDEDDKSVPDGIPPPDNPASHNVDAGRTSSFNTTKSKNEREKKIGHRRVGVGGEITYKKIQSTQIMGSIQLGIQHAIGGLASKPERDLLMQDFMTVETTNFPSEGSNHTPAHHFSEFKFKNYAPMAFRYFRDLFGIQPDDYLMSMCSAPLRELSNPGASGSIFYLTDDDEFIIKTVQHKEGEFLQTLLPGYYMNLNQNPRTLLPKFFGLYCYQCNSKNVRLVSMNNLLPSSVKLHQKYDLKGSTYKRKASKSEKSKRSPTYKDLDFMEHHAEGILLESDTYNALIKTIQRDCRVLESFKIMDYSLLLGIHNLDQAVKENTEQKVANTCEEGSDSGPDSGGSALRGRDMEDHVEAVTVLNRSRSMNRHKLVAHSTALESIQADSQPIDHEDNVPPGGIPARNARGERLLLFIGIIDILQSYRLKKKLEHTFKSMIHDGDTVSVHRPGFYAKRFETFMAKKVFKKISSLDLPEIKGRHRKFRNFVTSYIALKHSPSRKKSVLKTMKHIQTDQSHADYIQATRSYAGEPVQINIKPDSLAGDEHTRVETVTVPVATSTPVNMPTDSRSPLSGDLDNSKGLIATSVSSGSTRYSSGVQYPAVLEGTKKNIPAQISSSGSIICGKVPPPVPPRGNTSHKKHALPEGGILILGSSSSHCGRASQAYDAETVFSDKSQYNQQGIGAQHPGANDFTSPMLTDNSSSPNVREDDSASRVGPLRNSHEIISISDVQLEDRCSSLSGSGDSFPTKTSISVDSCSVNHEGSDRTWLLPRKNTDNSTPSWTEGTPSFTESSSSGDAGSGNLIIQNTLARE